MGKEITKKFGICDMKAMREKAHEVMEKVGVNIPVDAVMSDLSVGQQQMVEICKALMVDAKVIIMDEPTAALTESETEGLFKVINSLRKKVFPLYTFLTEWKRFLSFATELRFCVTASTLIQKRLKTLQWMTLSR
jgi:ABC-type branched-subunit amino acid transport system ATPase component